MIKLGTFTKDQRSGELQGSFKTASFIVDEATLVPLDRPEGTSDNYPAYRVLSGTGSEFGAAWEKVAQSGTKYLSVEFKDPTFNQGQPFTAVLFEQRDGSYALMWDAAKPQAPAPGRPAAEDVPAPARRRTRSPS